jgi:hypothetical protein
VNKSGPLEKIVDHRWSDRGSTKFLNKFGFSRKIVDHQSFMEFKSTIMFFSELAINGGDSSVGLRKGLMDQCLILITILRSSNLIKIIL